MTPDVVDHIAELAYLTTDDGRVIINLQIEGVFTRVEINKAQRNGIVADGAKMMAEEQSA